MTDSQDQDQSYGRSPALSALDDMRKLNALPSEERAKAAAEFVRYRLAKEGRCG